MDGLVAVCVAAHRRVIDAVQSLTDDDVRAPSRLPDWTRGHVLTHLADKSRSHAWVMGGAAAHEVRDQFPEGMEKAQQLVAERAGRAAGELRDDLTEAFAELEAAWAAVPDDQWGHIGNSSAGPRRLSEFVSRHLRDVEVHHVDLDIGYEPSDWPAEFVEPELAKRVADLPNRADHAELLAWLIGRRDVPDLEPW